MKLKKLAGSIARGGLSRKTFKKVGTIAAVAAATYFTGGAALPLIMKAAQARAAARASGQQADYSDLLNEAWDSSNVSNNIGLGGLVDQVRGMGDNPLVRSLQQTGRGVMAMRSSRRAERSFDEDEGDEEEEDVAEEDFDEDEGDEE
jgi:hypothetical protein